jgi:serine/threonine-protein kinase
MDPGPDLPQPGDVLSDKYTIVSVISEGGMGVVYEATHKRIGQRVAIKILHPDMRKTPEYAEYVERFEREARAAGNLKSRHAVRVLDVAETPKGLPYMVMDFLEGHDLQHELAERGPLPIEEAVEYLLQTCAAMAEAHDMGIVHRDLKPANLFMCQDEGEVIVRVLDFGISKKVGGDSSVTTTETSIGTPLYMSPEQVRSARTVDPRADIWSLGVIAYEMLAGKTPFTGESPTATIAAIVADEVPPLRATRPEIPEELARVVHQALQKDVTNRYADIRTFAAALTPFAPATSHTKIAPPRSSRQLPSSISQPNLPRPAATSAPSLPTESATPADAQRASGPVAVDKPGVTMPTWSGEHGPSRSRGKLVGAVSLGCLLGVALVAWMLRPVPHAATTAASAATSALPASAAQPPVAAPATPPQEEIELSATDPAPSAAPAASGSTPPSASTMPPSRRPTPRTEPALPNRL